MTYAVDAPAPADSLRIESFGRKTELHSPRAGPQRSLNYPIGQGRRRFDFSDHTAYSRVDMNQGSGQSKHHPKRIIVVFESEL